MGSALNLLSNSAGDRQRRTKCRRRPRRRSQNARNSLNGGKQVLDPPGRLRGGGSAPWPCRRPAIAIARASTNPRFGRGSGIDRLTTSRSSANEDRQGWDACYVADSMLVRRDRAAAAVDAIGVGAGTRAIGRGLACVGPVALVRLDRVVEKISPGGTSGNGGTPQPSPGSARLDWAHPA